mmetsp:Transcript_111272/g.359207  ORF Transcript_111272/g.359207 Transcript_111272/m.359207 type:complete len:216 (-) Transcript_111272:387-1034(-)
MFLSRQAQMLLRSHSQTCSIQSSRSATPPSRPKNVGDGAAPGGGAKARAKARAGERMKEKRSGARRTTGAEQKGSIVMSLGEGRMPKRALLMTTDGTWPSSGIDGVTARRGHRAGPLGISRTRAQSKPRRGWMSTEVAPRGRRRGLPRLWRQTLQQGWFCRRRLRFQAWASLAASRWGPTPGAAAKGSSPRSSHRSSCRPSGRLCRSSWLRRRLR